MEQMVIKHIIHSRDFKKLSRASIEAECTAIFHFCEMNDLVMNKKKIKRFLPPDESTHDDRLYTDDEMQRIITECSKREGVIILLMTSGGIRIGAINKLKVKDLELVKTPEGYQTFEITVDRDSKPETYWTTCTFECFTAVGDYLLQRERDGEGPVKPTSPLIREHHDTRDVFRMTAPRKVADDSIRYTVRQVLKRSGVYVNAVKKQMSHSFRKNFKPVCEQSGMKSLYVEMLMGHREALVKSYMRPKDMDVIQDYITHAADLLTVNPTQRLKQENAQLRKNQTDYLAELGDLRKDFNEMKQLLVHLSKESQKQLVDEFYQKVGDKADIEWSCDD